MSSGRRIVRHVELREHKSYLLKQAKARLIPLMSFRLPGSRAGSLTCRTTR
jgi:hypothetical protein